MDARIKVLAAGNALNAAAVGFVLPFFSIYAFGRSGAAAYVGALFAGSTALSALGRLLGGELADRLGRRPVLLAAITARSTCFVLMGVAAWAEAPLWAVSLLYLASSIPRGAFDPACDAMVADVVAERERPRAYAWLRVARNAGWATGPLIGGLGGVEQFGLLAVAGGAIGLLSAVLTAFRLSESTEHRAVERFGWSDLLQAAHHPLFRLHCLLTAGLFVVFAQFLVGVSLDLSRRLALTSTEIGWVYSLNGVVVVLAQTPVTHALSRFSTGPVMAFGTLLLGSGFLMMGLAAGFPMALAGAVVVTLGETITFPLGAAVAADLAPPDRRGRYLGVYGLAMDAGHGVGQILGGTGLDAFPEHPRVFWGAVMAIAAGVAAGFWRLGTRLQGTSEHAGLAVVSSPDPLPEAQVSDPLRSDP